MFMCDCELHAILARRTMDAANRMLESAFAIDDSVVSKPQNVEDLKRG